MSFRKPALIAVSVLALALTLLALKVGLTAPELDDGLTPGRIAAPPAASSAAPATEAAAPSTSTDDEPVAVHLELDGEATQGHLAALAKWAARGRPDPARLEASVRAARGEGLAAVGDALRTHLRRFPADAAVLLRVMAAEQDPGVLFQEARVLARTLDRPALRREAIAWLRTLGPARLGASLPLLLGRREDDALALELELWETHADATVRGRAAQVLAHVAADLPPARRARIEATAREQLARPEADPALVVGAADLLASPELDPADRALLARRLDEARTPAELGALAHALARSGTAPAELTRALRALRRTAPAPVRQACDRALRALSRP